MLIKILYHWVVGKVVSKCILCTRGLIQMMGAAPEGGIQMTSAAPEGGCQDRREEEGHVCGLSRMSKSFPGR